MFFKSTLAGTLLVVAAAAQGAFDNITVNPNSIDPTTRAQWCTAEFNTCRTLCSNKYALNNCDNTLLTFNCTCAANNSAPGLAFYKETMPTFLCEQKFSICNADAVNAPNSAQAQAECAATEASQCGKLDPANFTASAVSSSSSSSASSTATASGSGAGSSATSSSSKAAAATMAAVRNFGTGAFAVGAAAVFGVLL